MKKRNMKKRMTKKQKTSLVYEIIGRAFVRLLIFGIFEYSFSQLVLWAFLHSTIY